MQWEFRQRRKDGVDGGEDLRLGFGCGCRCGFVGAAEELEEAFGGAFGAVGAEFGGWGERAVGGVIDDFVDGLDGFFFGIRFGQVDAGGLEAVQEDSGAARVEVA